MREKRRKEEEEEEGGKEGAKKTAGFSVVHLLRLWGGSVFEHFGHLP